MEYHQLTMQEVLYLDEGIEEVTETYPIHSISSILSMSPSSPKSPSSLVTPPVSASGSSQLQVVSKDDREERQRIDALNNLDSTAKKEEDQRGQLGSSAKV